MKIPSITFKIMGSEQAIATQELGIIYEYVRPMEK